METLRPRTLKKSDSNNCQYPAAETLRRTMIYMRKAGWLSITSKPHDCGMLEQLVDLFIKEFEPYYENGSRKRFGLRDVSFIFGVNSHELYDRNGKVEKIRKSM